MKKRCSTSRGKSEKKSPQRASLLFIHKHLGTHALKIGEDQEPIKASVLFCPRVRGHRERGESILRGDDEETVAGNAQRYSGRFHGENDLNGQGGLRAAHDKIFFLDVAKTF